MTKLSKEVRTKAEEIFYASGGDILQLQKALGHKHVRSSLNYMIRNRLLAKSCEIRKA